MASIRGAELCDCNEALNLSNTSYSRHYSKLQRVYLVHEQSVLDPVYVTNPGVIQGWANPQNIFAYM